MEREWEMVGFAKVTLTKTCEHANELNDKPYCAYWSVVMVGEVILWFSIGAAWYEWSGHDGPDASYDNGRHNNEDSNLLISILLSICDFCHSRSYVATVFLYLQLINGKSRDAFSIRFGSTYPRVYSVVMWLHARIGIFIVKYACAIFFHVYIFSF